MWSRLTLLSLITSLCCACGSGGSSSASKTPHPPSDYPKRVEAFRAAQLDRLSRDEAYVPDRELVDEAKTNAEDVGAVYEHIDKVLAGRARKRADMTQQFRNESPEGRQDNYVYQARLLELQKLRAEYDEHYENMLDGDVNVSHLTDDINRGHYSPDDIADLRRTQSVIMESQDKRMAEKIRPLHRRMFEIETELVGLRKKLEAPSP